MIWKELVDRTEYFLDGVWCVHEIFTTKCPVCGAPCDQTITFPDFTEYYHAPGMCCKVYWTMELVPGLEDDQSQILRCPGYLR